MRVYVWQERYAPKFFSQALPLILGTSGPLNSYKVQSVNFDILCVGTVETEIRETPLEH